MKLTLQDVYDIGEGLVTLSKQEFAVKTAFRIGRNHKKIEDEISVAEKLRKKIIDKYKDEDAGEKEGQVKLKKETVEWYQKELEELMSQEVEIKLSQIYLHELGEKIAPRTLILLDKIISEGGDADAE